MCTRETRLKVTIAHVAWIVKLYIFMYIILDNQVDMLFEIFFQILFKKEIQVDSKINILLLIYLC